MQIQTHLVDVSALGDELVTDLDPRLDKVLVEVVAVNTEQLSYTATLLCITQNENVSSGITSHSARTTVSASVSAETRGREFPPSSGCHLSH